MGVSVKNTDDLQIDRIEFIRVCIYYQVVF